MDAFYVACERRRNTALIGKPVAITQYNRGGFVAISYEAKAQGIRKGDGIGERGQKELDFFKNRPEAVMTEVRSWCFSVSLRAGYRVTSVLMLLVGQRRVNKVNNEIDTRHRL